MPPVLCGYAAAPMRPAKFNAAAEPSQAMVTFVRESVWRAQPGNHYAIKANMIPGVLTMRSVLAPVKNTDDRIKTWPTKLKVTEVAPEKKDKYIHDEGDE